MQGQWAETIFAKLRRNCEVFDRGIIKTWLKERMHKEIEGLRIEGGTPTDTNTREQETQTAPWRGE